MFARSRLSPALGAIALALLLSAGWAWQDRTSLALLRLPDTDDVMRLQQVRDWLGGQAFGDLTQYRLANGVAMHWSRIGDLFPAALILYLGPLVGTHAAEVGAVILWPAMQFAALLWLVGAIAEGLASGTRGTAMILAALAYPTTALFMPGRIDHHALQLLLVLAQLAALLAPERRSSGALAGVAVALGAAIGLETLPFALLTGALVAWRGGARQEGFGVALGAGLLLLQPIAASGGACDTITPLFPAALAGALAIAVSARAGRARLPLLGFAGVVIFFVCRGSLTPCTAGPYGSVDPVIARLWLDRVAEAQPLLGTSFTDALRYAGLMIAGVAAGGWCARRHGGVWRIVLAYQLVSLALTLLQLRGVYLGAALAALPIAALLAEARAQQRLVRLVSLWLGGAGLIYPLAAAALAPPQGPAASCTIDQLVTALKLLPTGRVMAPIDVGAYAIGTTGHTLIAAPYHRNNAGNAAMYRFFLGNPAQAKAIGQRWRVDYVALCDGAFAETGAVSPDSIAGGTRPAWLLRLPTTPPEVEILRMRGGLPGSGRP